LVRRWSPRSTLFPYTTLFRSQTDFGWPLDGRDASSRAAAYAVTGTAGGRGGWHRVSRCSLFARDFFEPGVASYARWSRFCWLLRSEEHTSELQSRFDLVCRLL